MPEIPSIGHGAVGPINRAAGTSAVSGTERVRAQSNGVPAEDRVELSDRAKWLDKLRQLPEVRQDLIDRIKEEIDRGTYDTPGRLEGALEQLIEDLSA